MKEFSKRQLRSFKRHFKHLENRQKEEHKFHHRSPLGDAREKETAIEMMAKKVDRIIIVVSFVLPPLKVGLIDRFLVMASKENVQPIIVFNKVDLLESACQAEETSFSYRQAGYPVFLTSTVTGEGIEELKNEIRGKVSLLAGHSGVGKSSLLNCIEPDLPDKPETREISLANRKGKHTTTSIKFYRISDGTTIFDLPGIKVASFYNVKPEEIKNTYHDFFEFARQCRFSDCTHTHEPSCGVKRAVEDSDISVDRYESYLKVMGKLKIGQTYKTFLKSNTIEIPFEH
jgi:ribosome biogenesis GTPase / thiamine phosphate phosphatase